MGPMVERIALNVERTGRGLVLVLFDELGLVGAGHGLTREFEGELVGAYNFFGLHWV